MAQAIVRDSQGNEIAVINIPEGATEEQVQQKINAVKEQALAQQQPTEGQQQAQQQEPPPEPTVMERIQSGAGSLREMVTGNQRQAALPPEVQELSEFANTQTGAGMAADIQMSAGMLTSMNPEAQKDIIKNAMPEVTFEEIDGTTVIRNLPNGQSAVLNSPGMSAQDVLTGMGQVLAYMPISKVALLGKTLKARMGIGAAGSAATEAGLQGTSQMLGSEQDLNKTDIAIAGGLGGAAEVVVPALQAGKQAVFGGSAAMKAEQEALSKEAVKASKAMKTDLFPAQITNKSSDLERQSFVGTLPAGTERSTKAIRKQNAQVADATEEILSQIAPARSVETGAKRFRTAAQDAIAARKLVREEKASPFYQQAKKENVNVDTSSVISLIDSKLSNLAESSASAKALKKVKTLILESADVQKIKAEKPSFSVISGKKTGTKAHEIRTPKLRPLHNTKLEIDQILNAFGENSLGRTSKSHVKDVQVALLDSLDNASPTYKQARQTFADNSPLVNELEDSIIGQIAKLDDTQLKTVSTKIFSASETNPTVLLHAKKAIQDVDPDAWNELLRVELERRVGSMKGELSEAGGDIANVPAQIERAIFGNTKQRRILMSAVDADSEVGKNLRYLLTTLLRAGKGRPGGSQTATRTEMQEELKGGLRQWGKEWVSHPIEKTLSVGDTSMYQRRVKRLADALFDTEWQPALTAIRKADPKGNASSRALMQLVDDIEAQDENSSKNSNNEQAAGSNTQNNATPNAL